MKYFYKILKILLFSTIGLTQAESQNNYSLSFDGVDDYVTVYNPHNLNVGENDFTIKVIFKVDPNALESGKTHQLISKRGTSYGKGYEIVIGNSGMLQATIYDDNSETPFYATSNLGGGTEVADGNWHTVHAVFDRDGYGKLFLDGIPGPNTELAQNLNIDNDYAFNIGHHSALLQGRAFKGNIEEVSLWSYALSESQISDSMNENPTTGDMGLIAHWNFSEGEGSTLTDLSGNGNHGTIIGATWSTDYPSISEGCTDPYANNYNSTATEDDGSCAGYPSSGAYSLDFDGVDDYTSLSWSNQLSTYTVSMWVISNEVEQSTFNAFFSTHYPNSSGFQFDSDGGNGLRMLAPDFELNFTETIPTYWSHVAIVAQTDGSDKKTTLYFNGDSVTSIDKVESGWNKIDLGRNRNQTNPGNWKVDEVSVWNTARTPAQIQSDMYNPHTGAEDGLLVYWRANAGTGNILYDHSGNANHATINGASWSTETPILFQPQTKQELQTAVDLWVSDSTTALETYGDISVWDVSLITDMSQVFKGKATFNSDISAWDVSSVTTSYAMFDSASNFNQYIAAWDVSNVTDMHLMFYNAHSFNQNLSSWDVSNVTDMQRMFLNAHSFNQNLSSWDVSNVTNMQWMFLSADSFNQDLSSWDVSNVTNMGGIFDNTSSLSDAIKCNIHISWSSNDNWPYDWTELCEVSQVDFQPQTKQELQVAVDLWISDSIVALETYGDISNWDVSLITDFSNLFRSRTTFNGSIGNWDVSSVTNMYYAFNGASSFNQDLSGWDVSNVNTMHMMFPGCRSFSSDLSDWDVSNVTDMHRMFHGANNFTSDLSNWDVSNVTNMASMFNGVVNFTSDLSNWNVSNVTNLEGMFKGCGSFTSDLSGWDVSNAVLIAGMFENANSFSSDLSAWNVSNVTNMWGTFQGASSFNSDLSTWNISNVVYFNNMFNGTNLSVLNQCSIHESWLAQNNNWPYDWSSSCGVFTRIADENFEQVIIDLGYDDTIDGQVLTDSIIQIQELHISAMNITDLTGIEDFQLLKNLYCHTNELINVDLRDNQNIVNVNLNNNQITSILIDDIATLERLDIENNSLSSISFTNNTNLEHVNVSRNNITEINVGNLDSLRSLKIRDNNISEININNNSKLEQFDVIGNNIADIDLSNNLELKICLVGNNNLSVIDVDNNVNLNELQVFHNQITNIDVSSNDQLKVLTVSQNEISTLDITNNPLLERLACDHLQLSSIDLSNNLLLREFNIWGNELTEIDFSNNPQLTHVSVADNNLTILDLSNQINLLSLHSLANQLTSLDLTNNPHLEYIQTENNPITQLDLSNNTELKQLNAGSMALSSLDLSNNVKLTWLYLVNNQISSLDVSNNPDLAVFYCGQNQLNSLNMKNGMTEGLSEFSARDNPLTCIETLDPRFYSQNFTFENGSIDENVIFSTNCNLAQEYDVPYYFYSIQNAINLSDEGDTILVAPGIYEENLVWSNKNLFIFSTDGPEYTIIDGNSAADTLGAVMTITNVNSRNNAPPSVLEGFTLKNGKASEFFDAGGIKLMNSNLHLKNLIIEENYAFEDTRWSGVLIGSGEPFFSNCIIRNNEGSGVRVGGAGSKPSFDGVEFSGHVQGRAIEVYDTGINMTYCKVINNPGGGIWYTGVGFNPSRISATLFAHNGTENSVDGALHVRNAGQNMAVDRCTFYGNRRNGPGADIYSNGFSWDDNPLYQGNNISVINTIFSESNYNPSVFALSNQYSDSLKFSHCLFAYADTIGLGDDVNYYEFIETIHNQRPEFCNPMENDFSLAENSPAIGAGDEGDIGAFSLGCGEAFYPPVAGDLAIEVLEDTEYHGILPGSIGNSRPLFFEITHEPINGIIDLDEYSGSFRYHPRPHFFGMDSMEYTVSIENYSDTGMVSINVISVNDAPVLHNHFELVGVGLEFEILLDAHDIDIDTQIPEVFFPRNWQYPDWVTLASDPYRLQGTAPDQGMTVFPIGMRDGDTTVVDTFRLQAEYLQPRIVSITDVPDDQGGRVYIEFLKTFFDRAESSGQMYTVFREDIIDNYPRLVVVGSGAAIGVNGYTYEIPTRQDSTVDNDGLTTFMVVASTHEGVYSSDHVQGYSIDNIAPGVPAGFELIANHTTITVTWDRSADEDFQYFVMEKSSSPEFTGADVEMFEMIDTIYTDESVNLGQEYFYRVLAVDDAGNRSEYSEILSGVSLNLDLTSSVPEVFSLHQNFPNPFNPITSIRYDLPEDNFVNISIYDLMGRKVKSLINSNQSAGYRSVHWDATNDFGQTVSAGMYIYIIQAGEFKQTKKMVLLK